MMINKNLNTKETNVNIAASKGEKRKLSSQTTVEETKSLEVKKKAPLKAELIEKLKALEKKYEELEKENDILKLEKVENINTIEKLKKKVTELEELATVEKDVEELD